MTNIQNIVALNEKYKYEFAEEIDPNSDPNKNVEPTTDPNKKDETIPKHRFDEINSKYKEMSKQLEAFKTAQTAAETKRAEDERVSKEKQGEFEALYKTSQGELETLKGSNSHSGERVATLETVINGLLETKMVNVPKEFHDLIPENLAPEQKLAWVNSAESKGLFGAKPKAPVGGTTNPNTEQTSDLNQLSPMQMLRAAYGTK